VIAVADDLEATLNQICFPPNPNPRKPRLQVPPGAWDTHFHVYGPPHVFPFEKTDKYIPPACPIEHYLGVAKILGFERGVVVLPTIHGTDPAVIIDAMRKADGRLKGVTRADPKLDSSDLKALHAAGVRGVRIELRKLGKSFNETDLERVVSAAASMNWVLALHVEPDSLITHAERIRRLPSQVIIENFALMDAREGVDQPALRTLVDLSREPHIWLKTASAYRMLRKGATYEQVLPIARAVHAASPDRTIWGTDWPHPGVLEPGQMQIDEDLVDMLIDFVPDEVSRRKLLVDNPKRLFDFD
jgi:predicted TIM-barrel fold metal-dependent hydrolase